MRHLIATFACILAIASCDKSGGETASPDDGADANGSGATAQNKEGGSLYGGNCAGCHGPAGKGGESTPALIGPDALPPDPAPSAKTRTGQFNTAADLVGYVSESMPPGDGGSLAEDEYYAIVGWLLNVNGWKRDEALTADNAGSIQLSR